MEKIKRVTKKMNFERIIEVIREANVEDADALIECLEHEIELVSKKRTGMTKTQKENEVLVEKIYEVINDQPATVTDIYAKAKDIEGITSSQKVAALIKKLMEAGKVDRIPDKKKAYFVRI